MDVTLCKSNTTNRTFPVTVTGGVIDALPTEDMGTGFKSNLSFSLGSTTAHDLGLVLLHLHSNDLVLVLLLDRLNSQPHLVYLEIFPLLILSESFDNPLLLR